MHVCVVCRAPVKQLTRVEQGATILEHCKNCGSPLDPYLEKDVVHSYLDLILLREQCWTHMMYNKRLVLARVALVIFLTCFLEVYVHTILSTPDCQLNGEFRTNASSLRGDANSVAVIGGGVSHTRKNFTELLRLLDSDADTELFSAHDQTLQLVEVLPRCRSWSLFEKFCVGVAYSIAEAVFAGIGIVWAASLAGSSVQSRGHGGRGIRAVALSSSCLFFLALFLIWEVPMLMLSIVDVARIIWVFVAVKALSGASTTSSIVMGVLGVSSRVVFKVITRWSPLFFIQHVVSF